jgi:lantibiotic modifying enzyme
VALAVKRLAQSARPRRPGVAWRTDPEWIPAAYRRTPHLEWNLGVAHGAPGAIALLGRVVAAATDAGTKRQARALLDKAVAWVLAQELPRGSSGRFGDAVGPGVVPRPTRTAWCYGDLGIAAALLVAARGAKQRSWERAAVRIGLAAASRPADESGVVDTGLCHGAAGAGHVFHRLFLATGEPRFADAARFWFARLLAMRGEHRGFAGFAAYGPDGKGKLAWTGDAGFLTGAAGVTLALVAAITEDAEPVWDRALLIS